MNHNASHYLVADGHAATNATNTYGDAMRADTLCGLTRQPLELDLHGDPCLAELDPDGVTCNRCWSRWVEAAEPNVHNQLRDYLVGLEAGTVDIATEDDNQECLADWVHRVHGLPWSSADWKVEWDGNTPVGLSVYAHGLAIRYVLPPAPSGLDPHDAATAVADGMPVYVTRDRLVILCPECRSQDEVDWTGDRPGATEFVCGDCGTEFDREDALLCHPGRFQLMSRGHVIDGPYRWVVVS